VTERTLVLVKPSGVARGSWGRSSAASSDGTHIKVARHAGGDSEMAARHYAEHTGEAVLPGAGRHITSAPIFAWW